MLFANVRIFKNYCKSLILLPFPVLLYASIIPYGAGLLFLRKGNRKAAYMPYIIPVRRPLRIKFMYNRLHFYTRKMDALVLIINVPVFCNLQPIARCILTAQQIQILKHYQCLGAEFPSSV